MITSRIFLVSLIGLSIGCASGPTTEEYETANRRLNTVSGQYDKTMELNYRLAQRIKDLEMIMILNELTQLENSLDSEKQRELLRANYDRVKNKSLEQIGLELRTYRLKPEDKVRSLEFSRKYGSQLPENVEVINASQYSD